jgi:hypothetical protein
MVCCAQSSSAGHCGICNGYGIIPDCSNSNTIRLKLSVNSQKLVWNYALPTALVRALAIGIFREEL